MYLNDYSNIADSLLEAAGYSLTSDTGNICPYKEICQDSYDVSSCDPNDCKMLFDLRRDNLNKEIKNALCKKLGVCNKNSEEKGLKVSCPRALQTHAKIQKYCKNTDCHFNSKKMAFHCLLLHSRTFFPVDESIPNRVIEVSTGLSDKQLDRLNVISIYLIRIYLILFKYGLENLKLDYSLTFQTKYIYELLHAQKNSDYASIECCPICGAVLMNKKHVKMKIGNTREYVYVTENNCDCRNPDVLEERQYYTNKWRDFIMKERYVDYGSISKMNYYSMVKNFGSEIRSPNFIRYLISKVTVNGVNLGNVPLGFILYSYSMLFGYFRPENLGISQKIGTKLYELFVRGESNNNTVEKKPIKKIFKKRK